MRVISLFDGISCARVALERAGIKVDEYYAYEVNKDAIKVSMNNYSDIKQMGDVIEEDFTKYAGKIDLLVGGSPCQSLSIARAKEREHLKGKSRLFYEFVRALEEVKPKYFLFENVASMNKQSRDVISSLLGCEPIMINSASFSAQERKRYYWTNIPIAEYKDSNLVMSDILQENVPEKYYYNCDITNYSEDNRIQCNLDKGWNFCMSTRVYNPGYKSPTLTCVTGGYQEKKVFTDGRPRKLTPLEYERLQTLPDNYTEGLADSKRYTAIGNGFTVEVISHILKGINVAENRSESLSGA